MNITIEKKEKTIITLLTNTTNISLKQFLIDYRLAIIKKNPLESEDLLRLDNCIEFIIEQNFDIEGWLLWDIPIFYSHRFVYHDHSKAFDLAVLDIGEVIPRYLDGSVCEQDAVSIDDAILKYDMHDYYMHIVYCLSNKICEYSNVNKRDLEKCLFAVVSAQSLLDLKTLYLCDAPEEGLYILSGKTVDGKDVAFDLEFCKGTNVVELALTIDSNVYYYDSFSSMATDWHKHDLLHL